MPAASSPPRSAPQEAPGGRAPVLTALAILVLALTIVPIGGAVFVLGFGLGDSPCVMCWEQRIGMTLVALTGLFILRYGPRPRYVGMAVLIAAYGIFMGMRHTGMHAARDVGQGFSLEILGAHTYTWSLFIYWACLVMLGALLLSLGRLQPVVGARPLPHSASAAGVVFVVVVAANAVQAFASTGPPPFLGQSDPVRFSFNPTHWSWSLGEWRRSSVSLRGRWSIDKPGVPDDSGVVAAGPFGDLPRLAVRNRQSLPPGLSGTPTDIAFDAATAQFVVTTERGVYLADSALSGVTRYTLIDPGYSIDIRRLAGAAFLEQGLVLVTGENKSYVLLRPDDTANAHENFRYFLESFDHFSEVSRSRLGTVRARMMYVMSLAYDPVTNSVYTVTVPNNKVQRLVVSRFDRRDFTLSEEFTPTLAAESGLRLGDKRSLDELYVVGAAMDGAEMLALSARYGVLLTIDPARHAVVAAHVIPGLSRPTGIAVRGDGLYIVQQDGTVVVAERPQAMQVVADANGK